MKRALAILVVAALTLVSASAAFAQPLSAVVYGNTQSGSVSYGSFGHAWYSDGAVDKGPIIPENVLFKPVVVKGVFQDNSSEGGSWYSYFDTIDNQLINGQWEFYKDSRGVRHYFYIDPNRQGEYRQYTDQNGVAQYYYDYTN